MTAPSFRRPIAVHWSCKLEALEPLLLTTDQPFHVGRSSIESTSPSLSNILAHSLCAKLFSIHSMLLSQLFGTALQGLSPFILYIYLTLSSNTFIPAFSKQLSVLTGGNSSTFALFRLQMVLVTCKCFHCLIYLNLKTILNV